MVGFLSFFNGILWALMGSLRGGFERSAAPSQEKSHGTVCQVTSHQEACSREGKSSTSWKHTSRFTHTCIKTLWSDFPFSLGWFMLWIHWSAGLPSAWRRQTAGCDPAATGSGSAQPLSAEISELHLIRNRTLWPLSLSAFLPFHFMSPIPCSDFIYLHGDAIKKKKERKGDSRGRVPSVFLQPTHSQSVPFTVK